MVKTIPEKIDDEILVYLDYLFSSLFGVHHDTISYKYCKKQQYQ